MNHVKVNKQPTKREFNIKDTIVASFSLSLTCAAVILLLIANDVLGIENFLSFDQPIRFILYTLIATTSMLILGIILTLLIPAKYIDETNQSYHNYSLLHLFAFMFLVVLFEELLFRGIIQNLLVIFIKNQWAAICIATLLFLGFHTSYFKKPVMFLNIALPGLTFGWIYAETNNILVPFTVHFLTNIGMTLLFKFNIMKIKS